MACALKILWHQWKRWGGRRARAQREPARGCAKQEKGPRRSREGHSRSLSTHDEVMPPEPFATGDGLNRAALMESVLRLLGCFWRLGRAASDRGMGGAGCARRRGMVRGGFAQRLATWGASTSLHLSLALPGKKTSKQKTSKPKNRACVNLPEPA